MENLAYPRLLRRIQAMLIDSLVFPFSLFLGFFVVSYFHLENDILRVLLSFAPAVLLEPFMVSFTGASFGHHIIGLKVRHINTNKNINIIYALIRFILKMLLGLPSTIFILTTKKHQALHDVIARSIVVYKDASKLPSREALEERELEEVGYMYPSTPRRIVVILAYISLSILILGLVSTIGLSDECAYYRRCTTYENTLLVTLSILWWISFFYFIVVGWKSRLYGCRRIEKENA